MRLKTDESLSVETAKIKRKNTKNWINANRTLHAKSEITSV